MKKTVLFNLALFIFSFHLYAESPEGLEKFSPGARYIGSGRAGLANVESTISLFWNPAGLASMIEPELVTETPPSTKGPDEFFTDEAFEKLFEESTEKQRISKVVERSKFHMELMGSYTNLTMDRQELYSGISFTLFKGVFGISTLLNKVTGIDGYDVNGNYTGNLKYQTAGIITGYAWQSGASKFGFSFSGYQESLDTLLVYGGGINAGWQMKPIPLLDIGFSIKNLAGAYNLTGVENIDGIRKLDTIILAGFTLSSPPPSSSIKLLVSFEYNMDAVDTDSFYGCLGLVYNVTKNFNIMAGVYRKTPSFGFGINVRNIALSFAVNKDPLNTGFQEFAEVRLFF